jgi:hypothetical protein
VELLSGMTVADALAIIEDHEPVSMIDIQDDTRVECVCGWTARGPVDWHQHLVNAVEEVALDGLVPFAPRLVPLPTAAPTTAGGHGRRGMGRVSSLRLGIGRPEPKIVPVAHGGQVVAFQLHDFEQVDLFAEALDLEGNPAGASYEWSSSDEGIVAIRDDGNGKATAIASPGAGGLGDAAVDVLVRDSNGNTFTGRWEVEVIPGDVVAVNIVPGTPAAKA